MSPRARRPWLLAAGLAALAAAGFGVYWFGLRSDPGDPRLNAFVHARPPVPVVFTSRTEPASLEAAAPEGEEFRYPGQRLWAAREGRLRLLTPRGTVHELTWEKPLPDGGTLIDVMSPSVSLDGKKVLFAGRKGGDDPGHFRLYEVNLDGSGLRQLTGGPDDPGCPEVPPMRFRPDGSVIPPGERQRTDYDDVDPIEISSNPRRIVFASSRTPDLGRDHARRSTTLWVLHPDGRTTPATANRNNDRWPFLTSSGYVAFSLWSRNREVVSADETDIHPYRPGEEAATRPTDHWLGAFLRISSNGHFGMLVKTDVPVWRPRPLSNGRIAFMTTLGPDPSRSDPPPPLTVVQAEPGTILSAPSARAGGQPLPRAGDARLARGPDRDADGRPLWLATPSPCPPGRILLAAAPVTPGKSAPDPGSFGLYLAADDWPEQDGPAPAAGIDLRLLFDDPDLVDAEPVAAYRRKVDLPPDSPGPPAREAEVLLAGGRTYHGPVGALMATALYDEKMSDLPGQRTDTGEGPIFTAPPEGAFDHLRIYAARRDRFDDPNRPRVPGEWELLLKLPASSNSGGQLPTDAPTVLAGFGKDGKVVRWTSPARDSQGRQATFYAFAGDHYSLAAPGGRTFCVGCHPGHSGIPRAEHRHAERVDD
jgi:hypothetical protein